jgi:TonB family protein
MSRLITSLAAAALVLAAFSSASAQTPAQVKSLAAARTLYASAEYGGALDMLNGLVAETPAGPERQAIELYRLLCYVAVGDSAEATRTIDAMIAQDPLFRPSTDDVPPRLRAAFADARRRLLPGIVQQTYVAAKDAFDKKEYAAAAKGFSQVLAGLSDPDLEGDSANPPLSDLKVLATGFNDLAAKAIAPPPPPPAPAAAPEPVVAPPTRVYSPGDSDVVPPVVIRQVVPQYPGRLLAAGTLLIDIVIDAMGEVESAEMQSAPNPAYDRMVLQAAKTWQYQPATLNGTPVKYRKRIQLALVPTAGR